MSPEQQAIGRSLEGVILSLPETYRTVLVLREIKEMSTAETCPWRNCGGN
jgi:DNA-directed RNA polymerase specialized sigma24 family protein